MEMTDFIIGHHYTRQEVNHAFGGEHQSYLPQHDHRIVAGCFGRALNPRVPEVVQVGESDKVRRKARTLSQQTDNEIPVFVKNEKGEAESPRWWRYQGRYVFDRLIEDEEAVERAARRADRSGEVAFLLKLRPIDVGAEPAPSAEEPVDGPTRREYQIMRTVRDGPLAREVKAESDFVCRVCEAAPIMIPSERHSEAMPYAEAHHIQPLGKKHAGPDKKENILCVCPNCHVKLDYGIVGLDAGRLAETKGPAVGSRFVDYHNSVICEA
jgi:hypothetical protein